MKSLLYKILRISNDISAISKGKYGKRLVRKSAYKSTSKLLNKFLK